MEQLYEAFALKLLNVPQDFSRFLKNRINWNHRLVSILGARGAGKTTLLLQHIIEKFGTPSKEVLYADVSHFYFATNTLMELADRFYKLGGKYLFLDEIHKYPTWAVEIKQIYDTYSGLHIVFTGSSILEIDKGGADLSRRLVRYFLPGLSFREFLMIETDFRFEPLDLQGIVNGHMAIAHEIAGKIRPLEYFVNYLKYGYYPYFVEDKSVYLSKLQSTINLLLETDLPTTISIDYLTINKMKKLLAVIAMSVPFKPNMHKISLLTHVSRPTLSRLFVLLESAQLINTLQTSAKGIQSLSKPGKVYLNNTNLMESLAPENTNKGNLRETFFLNQLKYEHSLALPDAGDFLVDGKWIFEVGGKNKGFNQIANLADTFVVADDIETGFDRKIPLWLFGFLY
jgi:predicted AAA+ superfamily ATPase